MRVKIGPLDKLLAHYIKLRDKNCQRCGGSGGLQTAHFIGRSRKSTRYDESNCILLCFGCHQHFHSRPYEWTEWFKRYLGEERFNALLGRERITYPKPDKKLIALYLKEQIKQLEEVK